MRHGRSLRATISLTLLVIPLFALGSVLLPHADDRAEPLSLLPHGLHLPLVMRGHAPFPAATTRISLSFTGVQANGYSESASISADGRYVAFESDAPNLVPNGTFDRDVFVHDRETRQTVRVSVSSAGVPASGHSGSPSISADGRYIAFQSDGYNLVPGDTNDKSDIFVHDRATGETSRISVSSTGTQANDRSGSPSISADGRYVAFQSVATNLVPGDTYSADIFVHDRATGETTRVAMVAADIQPKELSRSHSISADGRYIAFHSAATNLVPGDTNGHLDVFVHDRVTGQTARVSVSSDGAQATGGSSWSPAISADGRYVSFQSHAGNLVPGDTNHSQDVFVHDRETGETTRVSVSSAGAQADALSQSPSISADGRYVAFDSAATNLVPGDTNGAADIFVHDRATGETSRVSLSSTGTQADRWSWSPYISADGRHVAFSSEAINLVPGDTNDRRDAFAHDRETGQTARVSVSSVGTQTNGHSWSPAISADGRYVAFHSHASNLVPGDTNHGQDIFVYDRVTGEGARVSVSSGGAQANGNPGFASMFPSISADGRYVAFESDATNLVPGDTNNTWDVFVHDRATGQTSRVSVSSGGVQATGGESWSPAISADGRHVAFVSAATNLVPGDTNGVADVFVHDRITGQTSRVSVATGGVQANGNSGFPSISADGRHVAFASAASNLVPGDTNGMADVFVHDRVTGGTSRVSVATGGAQANGHSDTPSISADGRYVAFESVASTLVPGDTNGTWDIFLHDRVTGQTTRVSISSAGAQANGHSGWSSISADGRYVAFASAATNLVSGDTNGAWDVFVRDRVTGGTTRISVSSAGAQATGGNSWWPSISADGRYVAFQSGATNLVHGDTNNIVDIFLRDRGR
jgi:Tol biopolymer transport system component